MKFKEFSRTSPKIQGLFKTVREPRWRYTKRFCRPVAYANFFYDTGINATFCSFTSYAHVAGGNNYKLNDYVSPSYIFSSPGHTSGRSAVFNRATHRRDKVSPGEPIVVDGSLTYNATQYAGFHETVTAAVFPITKTRRYHPYPQQLPDKRSSKESWRQHLHDVSQAVIWPGLLGLILERQCPAKQQNTQVTHRWWFTSKRNSISVIITDWRSRVLDEFFLLSQLTSGLSHRLTDSITERFIMLIDSLLGSDWEFAWTTADGQTLRVSIEEKRVMMDAKTRTVAPVTDQLTKRWTIRWSDG